MSTERMNSGQRVYLVLGAYGGIGTRLTERLQENGAGLAVSGRDPGRLRQLAEACGAVALAADATDFSAVDDVVAQTVEHFGRIDGVANCVGSLALKPAHMTSAEEWERTVHTNLSSAFATVRAVTRVMSGQQDGGSIVLVSSAAASMGLANHEAIAAAKGGVDALVRSAAATYGKAGIRINSVAPGLVETPLTQRITSSERARATSESMHALGRLGRPDDVAGLIAWLLGEESTWITGQNIGVDGGLGAVRSA